MTDASLPPPEQLDPINYRGRPHWYTITIAVAGAMLAVGFFLLAIGYIGQHNQLREQDVVLTKDSSILARPSLVLGYNTCYNDRLTAWIDKAVASTKVPRPNLQDNATQQAIEQMAYTKAQTEEESARLYLDQANDLTSVNVCKELVTAKNQADASKKAGK